jgi:hypothetical protein
LIWHRNNFESILFFNQPRPKPLPNGPRQRQQISLEFIKMPNADVISSASLPFGSPAGVWCMIFQKKEWLACRRRYCARPCEFHRNRFEIADQILTVFAEIGFAFDAC